MDVKQLLREAKAEPSGIIARGTDGRLFFLPDAQADQLAIPDSTMYTAFRLASEQPPVHVLRAPCARVKRWLDTHSPNSEFWRRLCLAYFNNC